MGRMYTKDVEIVPGFRLVKLLGRGGFGEVWKATAPGGTEAAIKIISLGERYGYKEFRAIKLVKQIRHPNLVPIIAFWLVNQDGEFLNEMAADSSMVRRAQEMELIIAMGLGDKSLLDRLRECQKEGKPGIPVEELLSYMEDAAKAIDYLNQPIHDLGDGIRGIQHCDIKPQNILIVGGAAQVCDFGLARVLGDSRVTSAKGSAAYMAPEMIVDNKPSKTTDQYFLAVSYVELRTGSLPIDVASPAAAIWAHVQGKLNLAKLPAAEQEAIKRATAVDPAKRFPTTLEMVRALRQASEGTVARGSTHFLKLDERIKEGNEVVPGYKLIRLLGKGGYGEVWEASAPGGKHVALKIIRHLEGVQGKQEFKALELIKGVDHNHLMELHAYWLLDRQGVLIPDDLRNAPDAPEPSTLVIASKLANKNLMQRLKECQAQGMGAIPIPELLGYMRQAAQAVDYLNTPQHQLGGRKVSIQHRDIKPENILLAADVVKVGDFGLAKVVEGTSAVIHGDSTGLTLAYAAPEMFTNVVTSWSDQYCLALTYFKLRTGGWPFPPGSKPNEVIQSHVQGKLDLSQLTEVERSVIARATALKPEKRYPNCSAMVEELEHCFRNVDTLDDELPMTRLAPLPTAPTVDDSTPYQAALAPVSPKSPTVADLPEVTPPGPVRPKQASFPAAAVQTRNLALEPIASDTAPHPARTPAKGEREETIVAPPTGDENVPTVPAQRPPTHDKMKLETREIDLAVEVSQTPSKRKTALAWKGEQAARPKGKSRGILVLLFVLFVLSVAVLGGGAYLFLGRKDSPLLDRTAAVRADVEQLIAQEKYGDAVARLNTWGVASQTREDLRHDIRSAWTGQAKKELYDLKDYVRADETTSGLLEQFPHDFEAKNLRENARLAAEVAGLLAQGRDFAAVDQKLAAPFLDDGLRHSLHRDLRRAWLARTQKELYEDKNFTRAEKTAADMARCFPDDPEAKNLRRQARAAASVQAQVDAERDYAAADRLLDTLDSGIDDRLRDALRAQVLSAWLAQARKELGDGNNHEQVAQTTAALLARHPANAEALKIRREASGRMLKEARQNLDEAVRLGRQPRPNPEAIARLAQSAGAGARKARGLFGNDDPEIFRILGLAGELNNQPEEAYVAYDAGLPEPEKATIDSIGLLLARLEFLLNSKWDDYHQRLGFHRAFFINKILKSADRAVELVDQAPVDAAVKARALAVGGRARIHAIDKLKTWEPEKLYQTREEALAFLRTAIAQEPDYPESWFWRYELAGQLRSLMIGANPVARKKYREEALKVLAEAKSRAPATEVKNRIEPLIKEVEGAR